MSRLIKQILATRFQKATFLVFLLLFLASSLISCWFSKLNESVNFFSCSLINFLLLFIAYILIAILTITKKCRLIIGIITIPIILFLLSILVFSSFVNIYLLTDIFKTKRLGPRTCSDGRQIFCNTNKDCKWERIVKFCNPSTPNPTMWTCAPSLKCSPNKICEDYCHP